MQINIGIKKKNLAAVASLLSTLLADEYILYTKTRNAHWNVEGPDFHAMHIFFESQYKEMDEIIDEVAERIRTLGQTTPGTLKCFLQLTQLEEIVGEKNESSRFIQELLSDHEKLLIQLRGFIDQCTEEYKDTGSADFITGVMALHEKMAWMLRMHLS